MKLVLIFVISISLLSPLYSQWLLNSGITFSQSVEQRLELSVIAGHVIANSPVFGVGLGQFIREIPIYSTESIWWLQPVHNLPLLVVSETGLGGLILFFTGILIYLGRIKSAYIPLLLFILLTGTVDHYWLTSHQNMLLMTTIFGIMVANDSLHK